MNEYPLASIPLLGQLGTTLQWLMLINALLIGAVVLLACRTAHLSERVRELEQQLEEKTPDSAPPPPKLSPLADDRPIPLVRHRFGSITELFKHK